MISHRISVVLSWIAILLAIACALGLILSVAAIREMAQSEGPGPAYVFLIATAYLALFGVAALVAGGLGLFLSGASSTPWHARRCWLAILLGVPAAAMGLMYGAPLLF